MADRKLVPYDEAQHLLGGIGRTMLWQLANSGHIERVKIGNRGFITLASIDRYIEELMRGSSD